MAVRLKNTMIGKYPGLEVAGRIIDSDSEKFAKKIQALCSGREPKVVIDLTNVEFLDSFGLGLLVRCRSNLMNEGRELVFLYSDHNPHSFLWRLFEMTGLRTYFRIVDSPDEV
jgi:anti-anti-sigma factor